MTKLEPSMYRLAERTALSYGPRVVNINGKDRTVYCLSKKEIKDLFRKQGFKVDGITWLKYIGGWRETWDELVPNDGIIRNPDCNDWHVVFIHPIHSDYVALQRYAEDHNIPSLAVEP